LAPASFTPRAHDLLERGAHVAVFDDFSSGLEANLAAVAGEVELIRGTILDPAALARAMRGRDAVSHHAAQLEITKCIDDPLGDLTTNVIGTINVLAAARDAGVKKIVKRVVGVRLRSERDRRAIG